MTIILCIASMMFGGVIGCLVTCLCVASGRDRHDGD